MIVTDIPVVVYEATSLGRGVYVVRPKGQIGAMGWHPVPWTVQYILAASEPEALRKAATMRRKTGLQ